MDIILYVLDALRKDHLGCYGYERNTSPNIDALAKDGVIFENGFTVSTWTKPVAASILTGTYPEVHNTRFRNDMFSSPLNTIQEVLKKKGFGTGGFSTMGNVSRGIGFHRGFDEFYDIFRDPEILDKRRKISSESEGIDGSNGNKIALPLAEDINVFLFKWLKNSKDENTFSFIWSIETHAPYDAPKNFARFSTSQKNEKLIQKDPEKCSGMENRMHLIDAYDDEIYYNDDCIGKMIEYLKRHDKYEQSMIIVTGDHGDAFFEHELFGHGHLPHEELIRVPLIIKFPGYEFKNRSVGGIVELIDIYPTICEVAGLKKGPESSGFVQGRSLVPLIEEGGNAHKKFTFSDTQPTDVQSRYLSIRSDQWKYIRIHSPKRVTKTLIDAIKQIFERKMVFKILFNMRHYFKVYFHQELEFLYNLETDPFERKNLVHSEKNVSSELQNILAEWENGNRSLREKVGGKRQDFQEDDEIQRHLEELGYM